jgi:hypothetical protein
MKNKEDMCLYAFVVYPTIKSNFCFTSSISMSLSLTSYLNEILKKMNSSSYCRLKYSLEEYQETSRLLGAAGHNTANLDGAIKETSNSMDKLIQANATAVANFKLHGIISFQSHEITEDESAKLQ